MSLSVVAGPAAEPVSVSDFMLQLGMGTISDAGLASTLNSQLSSLIVAARSFCESYTRSAFVTQKLLWKLDCFPWGHGGYEHVRRELMLPTPPFQSIEFVRYVDFSGTVQTLTQDTSYGTDPNVPAYAYQLDAGDDTQPARLSPKRTMRVWPPALPVTNSVQVQYKAGFGGPVTASMTLASAVLSGPVFLPGDVGQLVSVPGAGPQVNSVASALTSSIASVDENGQATLADKAVAGVSNATVWVGRPVPAEILQAIKFMGQFFYEQGGVVDVATPRVVMALLDPYRNLVS